MRLNGRSSGLRGRILASREPKPLATCTRAVAVASFFAASASAQPTIPTLDTGDASLNSAPVNRGRGLVHPILSLDVRNGDYARGEYDDDSSSLHRVSAPRLSLPLHFGVGWGGFYQAGTGTVTYGDVGLALSQPLTVSGRHLRLRAQVQALVRDPTLRALDGDLANRAAVVPLATVGVSAAF